MITVLLSLALSGHPILAVPTGTGSNGPTSVTGTFSGAPQTFQGVGSAVGIFVPQYPAAKSWVVPGWAGDVTAETARPIAERIVRNCRRAFPQPADEVWLQHDNEQVRCAKIAAVSFLAMPGFPNIDKSFIALVTKLARGKR